MTKTSARSAEGDPLPIQTAQTAQTAEETSYEGPTSHTVQVRQVPQARRDARDARHDGESRAAAHDALRELRARREAHRIWDNRLLRAFTEGALTLEDLRFVFSQYYLFARSHTRHLAALMTSCESDYLRARLVDSLWAEGGGHEQELRHAHIFRRFLARALGVTAIDGIAHEDATRLFVDECHRVCLTSTPLAGSAFLALGAEGIAHRLYGVFVTGLRSAGIDEADLALFQAHEGAARDHDAPGTLEQIVLSYAHLPAWMEACEASMELALSLHDRFLESLWAGLRARRVHETLNAIQSRTPQEIDESALRYRGGGERKLLFASPSHGARAGACAPDVDFLVERIPLGADVLDARILRVPAGKRSEEEGHAHETFLHVLRGWGRVVIGEARLEVAPGDSVLVPRWCPHLVLNLGETEIVCLAVTDFHLADKAFVGDARTYHR